MRGQAHAGNANSAGRWFYGVLGSPWPFAGNPGGGGCVRLVGRWELEVLHYKAVDVSEGASRARPTLVGCWKDEPSRTLGLCRAARFATRTWTKATIGTAGPCVCGMRRFRRGGFIPINPVTGHREQQIGRRISKDIVQVGARADGTPTHWRCSEITADSFHWIGEALQPDGQTWNLEGGFRARRIC